MKLSPPHSLYKGYSSVFATADRFNPAFIASFPRIISRADSFAARLTSRAASFAYPKMVLASVSPAEVKTLHAWTQGEQHAA